jgi:hypothetical protein
MAYQVYRISQMKVHMGIKNKGATQESNAKEKNALRIDKRAGDR